MKKIGTLLLAVALIATFGIFALGSGESSESDQGSGVAGDVSVADDTNVADNTALGDYSVDILSCRLAKDYEGKDVVIVKYKFANNEDDDAHKGCNCEEGTRRKDQLLRSRLSRREVRELCHSASEALRSHFLTGLTRTFIIVEPVVKKVHSKMREHHSDHTCNSSNPRE